MSIAIIDYGMSNLGSISRAVEECGGEVLVTDNPKDLKFCDRMILPGVGSFTDGMKNLRQGGWIDIIQDEVINNKIPILGICLGMHLLSSKGYEGGKTNGLQLIPGEVKLMTSEDSKVKIPHVGWNEVNQVSENILFKNISNRKDFYFVHSYRFIPYDKTHIITTTPYCGKVISAINKDNIFGTQFHPEKSIPSGFTLIKNFINF